MAALSVVVIVEHIKTTTTPLRTEHTMTITKSTTTTTIRRTTGALAVTLALAASACGSDEAGGVGDVVIDAAESPSTTLDTRPNDLASALDEIVLDTGVPALGAALFDSDGMIDMAISGVRRRGDASVATVDDQFHIGSNTKAMTAALLARLAEHDRGITMETTLAAAFPDIADLDPGYADITMAQLLRHTGGTPGDELDIDESILSMPVVDARALGAELILSEPPVIEPGTVSSYSNPGYVIVGAAMEAATGESWEDLMTTELFAPLGMDSCGFGAPGSEDDPSQPAGHDAAGEPAFVDNPALLGPSGTVHCSMNDWGRFLVEVLNGFNGTSDFLSQESAQQLLEPSAVSVEGVPGAHSAAGWLVLDGPDGTAFFHNGSNTAWYSQAAIVPASNRIVLAVANEEHTGEQATGMAFAALSEVDGQ